MDFATIIRQSAQRFGDNVAVWDDGRERTHRELYERATRLCNALTDLGVQVGDRVAMLGPNAMETPEMAAGIAMGRFVRSALYAHETAEVNGYLLDLIEARVLLVDAELYPVIAERATQVASLEHVVVYGGEVPEGTLSYEDLLAGASSEDPRIEAERDDIHVIRFSAGTTGRPKGIVHTVEQWLKGDDEYRWVTPQIDERDVYLAAGQLTHAASLWLWPILQVGGRIVIMRAFDAGRALELIEQQRVTVTLVVPTMITALLNHDNVDKYDLSSMRCLNYAASPIAERTLQRSIEKFGEGVLYQLYAQSECTVVTMLQPHDHVATGPDGKRRLLRSAGRPTPNVTVKIVDPDGNELPAGQVGELAVRGPSRMQGLWRDEQGTRARTLDDGFLLTRDMAYLDDRGYVFLADRKEDLIISGGYNIWPAELENALASHPAVREVCVVGVPHEKWGETPHAFVVREPGVEVTEHDLIEASRELVGSVKKITGVHFMDELPKSGVGKILRRTVRDNYAPGAEALGRV